MKKLIWILPFILLGCGGDVANKYAGDALYGPTRPPKLDQRLLTPCPALTQTLTGLTEKEVLTFIEATLRNGESCRKEKQEWIDWYNKTFTK